MLRIIQANFWEALIAFVVLFVAGWQTFEAFRALYPNALAGRASQFAPLSFQKSFIIKSKKGCVGYLEGSFERTIESASYTLKGELFLKVQDKLFPTKVDLEASFNVLGQLAASILRVSNIASNLTLGWLNVDPVEITLLTSAEGIKPKRQTFGIPGPLLLREVGDSFELYYGAVGKAFPLDGSLLAIDSFLDLNITASSEAKSLCMSGEKSSLDIFKSAEQIESKLKSILPGLSLDLLPKM